MILTAQVTVNVFYSFKMVSYIKKFIAVVPVKNSIKEILDVLANLGTQKRKEGSSIMLFKLSMSGLKSKLQDYIVLLVGLIVSISTFYMFQTLASNKSVP